MSRITAIVSQKGGVTKTTTTMNLGAVTAEALGQDPDHPKVLVVNADPQQSSEWWSERVTDLPFTYSRVRDAVELHTLRALPQFRQILIDTPGSLEDGRILDAVLNVVDDVLVPLPPQPLAFDPTVRTVEQVLIPRGVPYRVFVSAWHPGHGDGDLRDTQEFIRARGWNLAQSSVRHYKVVGRAPLDGKVITQYPDSNRGATQAKNDFLRLALELGLGHPLAAAPVAPVEEVR